MSALQSHCISSTSILLKRMIPRTDSNLPKFKFLPIASTPKNERVGLKQMIDAMEELKENTRRELKRLRYLEPLEGMKLIDNLQWLGIGYHFEDEIDSWLGKLSEWPDSCGEDDLHATALRFRLLRQQLTPVSCDVFENFMEELKKRKSKKPDEGLLNLYEASYLGASGEDILSEAMKLTEAQLASSVENTRPADDGHLSRRISRALELPRHLRMVRLESRRCIEDCSAQIHPYVLELAKLDYNNVQLLHKEELEEFRRCIYKLTHNSSLFYTKRKLIFHF